MEVAAGRILSSNVREVIKKKNSYKAVRLTAWVDPPPPPKRSGKCEKMLTLIFDFRF